MRFLPCLLTFGVAVSLAAACGGSDTRRAMRGGAGETGEAGRGQAGDPSLSQAGGTAEPGGAGGDTESSGAGTAQGGAPQGGAPTQAGAGGAPTQAGAGGDAGGPNETVTVVDFGFDGQDSVPANLDPGSATLTPSQGFEQLGSEGNRFGSTFLRGPTGTVIKLTLTDLPPHTTLSLSMLFAAIDSLDGTGSFPAGDFFTITLDGVTVFRESFANATLDQIQSYNPPAAAILARRVDLGFGGPGSFYTDSAYDFGQDPRFQGLPHTSSSAVFVFTLEGEGVQSIDDESWAIDNVRVTAQ
jgi:hypothetical protein